jgi:nitrous oxidase accessory protein NosD
MRNLNRFTALTAPLLAVALAPLASGATLCVNPTGASGCQKTISAAVAAASPGDIINVAPGSYAETVTIGKPITLNGADAATTFIEAKGLSTGIYVDGISNPKLSGVLISGFTIRNANYEGILVANASGVTISNNILTGNDASLAFGAGGPTCPGIPAFETGEDFDCGEAIHLMGTDHVNVIGNSVTGNAGGILISDDTGPAHDNLIAGNNVSNNPSDCGITLASHPPAPSTGATANFGVFHNTVSGNTSAQNGLKGEGAGVGIFASNPGAATYGNVVVGNTLTGNDLPGVAMHGHTPGQNLNDNVIVGNTISGNGADTDDAATPGTAGIIISGISPITGTIISQNAISQEMIGVAIFAPGTALVERNSLAAPKIGVANLGRGGVVYADTNWWGCNNNPTFPISSFAGCSLTSGLVNVLTWMPAAPK